LARCYLLEGKFQSGISLNLSKQPGTFKCWFINGYFHCRNGIWSEILIITFLYRCIINLLKTCILLVQKLTFVLQDKTCLQTVILYVSGFKVFSFVVSYTYFKIYLNKFQLMQYWKKVWYTVSIIRQSTWTIPSILGYFNFWTIEVDQYYGCLQWIFPCYKKQVHLSNGYWHVPLISKEWFVYHLNAITWNFHRPIYTLGRMDL
jgi:hypothetical protein